MAATPGPAGTRIGSAESGDAAPRYAVISTIRNEEDYIAQMADALSAQTVAPASWLVVDDGSTDRTREILDDYARRLDWLHVVPLGDLEGSNRCSRVMRAFLEGYDRLEGDFDYVIKIDGDVTFEPDHIERLLAHFDEDPALGIASGTYTEPAGDGWREFTLAEGYAVGALRAYRSECLDSVVRATTALSGRDGAEPDAGDGRIGSVPTLSWDSIDHLYAEAAGWKTVCFHELVIIHHRTEGARSHVLRGSFEQGVVSYAMGYYPLYALARGLYKMAEYPYVVGGVALTLGYVSSALRPGIARADEQTRRLVRRRQVRRIRGALRIPLPGGGEDGRA